MVSLGQEVIAPYVKPDAQGLPLWSVPGKAGQPSPYLAYASAAYLGQMVDLILKEATSAIHLDRVYETDMAEGLKAMALEGHGIAFLPQSAVKKDVSAQKLVSALAPHAPALQITMEVRAYRERPASKESVRSGLAASRGAGVSPKRSAQALWEYLVQLNAA